MSFIRRSGLTVLLLAVAGGACAGEAPKVVVELFTSQGCSSCPPADELLANLASHEDVVALSLPVDYWDYLGWKDTLAERMFTTRQKGYGEVRGDRHVYTPQAVVNGLRHAVGSDGAAVQEAADKVRADGHFVALAADEHGPTIRIHVPEGVAPAAGATVYFLPLRKRSEVAIGRGENGGRKATYVNVVRDIVPLGVWNGAAQTFEIPASTARTRDADAFVAILQEGTREKPGAILGAVKGPGV
jgi:hypothetical protein